MEQGREELVNDFEAACASKDYTRAAELIRFTRFECIALNYIIVTF
jgi:hypothetical protein